MLLSLGISLLYPVRTVAAVSDNLNFQARLEGNNGAIVPDGNYNVEFKIYKSAASGGSAQGVCVGGVTDDCLWTEEYLNSASQGIRVANGYVTANLGSITSFPSNMPWDSTLYITMNIGGTTTGSPSWDGEMSPRLKLTAVPYAFQAKQAEKLQVVSGGNVGNFGFSTVGNNPTITLPDASGIVCLDSNNCNYASASGSSAYIQNGSALQGNANFHIQTTSANSTTKPTAAIELLTGQTQDLLQFQNTSGTAISGFNSAGQLYYQSGSFVGTLVQNTLTASTTYHLPDTGAANETVCLVSTCTGGAGGSLSSTGTANHVARFSTSTNIANSLLYDDGTSSFIGLGTSSNAGGLLSVVSNAAGESGVFIQNAGSSTVPVLDLKLGATPGSGSSFIDFRDSGGTLLATVADDGSVFSAGTGTFGSSAALSGTTGQLNVQAAGGSNVGEVIRAGGSQTGDLLQVQDNSGNPLSGLNSLGQLYFSGGGGRYGTITQHSLATTSISYELPDTGTASETICLVSTCTGGAGGSVTSSGTANHIALFTSSSNLGNSLLYQNGTSGNFLGLGTTTNSGLLSIQGSDTTQSSLFTQGADSATVPVVVIKGGATPGSGNDLLNLQLNNGTTVAKFDSSGNFSNSGTITSSSLTNSGSGGLVTSNGSGLLASGTVNRDSSSYFTGTLSVGNGGTGATTFTSKGILYGNGGSAVQVTGAGTQGQLMFAGASGTPAFTTVSGDISSSSSTTGQLTVAKLQGSTLTITSPAGGQYLRYNGTSNAFENSVLQASDLQGTLFSVHAASGTDQTIASGDTLNVVPLSGGSGNLSTTTSSGTKTVSIDISQSPTFTGTVTTSNSGGIALAVTGTPTASATAAQLFFGSTTGFTGNSSANGGTYIGANAPSSGAGSAADFLNFQKSGAVKLQVTSAGNTTLGGTLAVNGTGKTAITIADSGAQNSGLTIGGDTNLYRAGSGLLKTDTALTVGTDLTVTGLTTLNGTQLTNNGSTLNTSTTLSDFTTSTTVGTAAATVDSHTTLNIPETHASLTLTLPNPTSATAGRVLYVLNTGSADFTMHGVTVFAGKSQLYIWNGSAWVPGNIDTGGSGASSVGTIDTAPGGPSANGAVITSSTLYLQSASGTVPGLVNTGTQTFAGDKTFTGDLVLQGAGTGLSVTNNATIGGTLGVTGDFAVNTNKFQVTASNGNTIVGGSLQVKGITSAGVVLSDASGNFTSGTVDLANSTYVSGILPIANGGTNGTATPTQGGVAYGTGTAYAFTSAGTAGQLLQSNGTSAPTFVNPVAANTCSDCLVKVPSAGQNVITPTAASVVGLTVNGTSGTAATALSIVQGGAAVGVNIAQTGAATALNITQSTNNPDVTLTNTGATSSNLLSISQNTSAYTGTALLVNIANGSGSFASGNFLDLQKNGVSQYNITSTGTVNQLGDLNINTNKFQVTASNGNTSVGGTLGVTGLTTLSGGLTVTNGGNTAFQQGSNYSTTGSTNDVNFGTGELFRLTGASTQTITGIAGGADGRLLTLINAAGQNAVLSNQSTSSSANNRIITGTGSDLVLTPDAGVQLSYDASTNRWRVVGSVGGTSVNSIGTFDTSGLNSAANGASISGNSLYLQSATASVPGLVNTGTQTFGGDKTFNGALTISGTNTLTTGTGTVKFGSLTNGGTGGIVTSDGTGQLSSSVINRDTSTYLTGTLSVGNGGTGATTLTTKGILYGNGSSAIQATAAGTQGQLLFAGASGTPAFTTVSGDISSSSSTTGQLTISKLQGSTLTITSPTGGQYLRYDGTSSAFVNAALQAADLTGTIFSVHGTTGTDQPIASGDTLNIVPLSGGSGNLSTTTSSGTKTLSIDITQAPTFTGTITASNSTGTALAVTGTPTATATVAQLFFGNNASFTGNTSTNGGTYIGINAPTSSAGSAADFLNFQSGGTTVAKIASGGALTLAGTATFNNSVTIATGHTFTNASSTLLTAITINDLPSGGNIGTAAATVDVATTFNVNQTTAGQNVSLPSPTVTTAGRLAYVNNVGTTSFTMGSASLNTGAGVVFIWNGSTWVALTSGSSVSGVTTLGTIDTPSKSADGGHISGNTLYLQTADATFPGLVSTGTQTFAGDKTFGGALTISGSNTFTTGTGQITFSGRGAGLVVSDAAGVISSTAVDRNSSTYFNTALNVSNGGTGLSSLTAYGLIAAGTTSTGALQQVGTGTSGQILISGGSSGLPSFVNATAANTCSDCIVKVPTAGQNVIAPTAASVVGLTVKGTTNATSADVLDIYNAATTPSLQAFFDSSGSLNVNQKIQAASSVDIGTSSNRFATGYLTTLNAGGTTLGATSLQFTNGGGTQATRTIGIAAETGTSAGDILALQGGAASGTNQNGGTVTIDGGAKTGTGTIGSVVLQGSGGQVRIGNVTTPLSADLLEVAGSANQLLGLAVHNGTNGTLSGSALTLYNDNSGATSNFAIVGSTGSNYSLFASLTNRAFLLSGAGLNGVTIGNVSGVASGSAAVTFVSSNNELARLTTGGNFLLGNTSGTSLLSVGSSAQFTVDSSGNEVTSGTIQYANGATNTNTYACRNSSGQLAACNTTGTGTAFVQGGNSFGAAGDLGTNDAFNLNLRTNGTTRLTVDQSGNLQLAASGSHTLNIAQQSGTTAGDSLTIAAGQGGSGNAAGGVLALQGGAGAGTNQNGGNVTIDGGAPTGSGTRGTVLIQGTSGNTTVGSATTAGTITLQSGASSSLVVNSTTTAVSGFLSVTKTNTANSGLSNATTLINTTASPSSAPAGTTAFLGIDAFTTASGSNVNGNTQVGGIYGAAQNGSSNTLGQATGVNGQIFSAGNITNAVGVTGNVFNNGTGTFTNSYVLQATSPSSSSGTITNDYGLYVQSQKVTGVTNAYGVYQAGANDINYFGGSTALGYTTAPTSLGVPLAVGTTGQFQVDASGNLVTSGTIQYANGTANTNTFVCRNASGQLAGCSGGTGTAFVQGGNSFSAAGDLGTNDNFALNIRTNGTTKLTVSTAGDLTFASGAGNFDQSASSGTFKTGTGAVSLNGDTTVAANKNLSLASGTGSFSQTYSSTGTGTLNAQSLNVTNNNAGSTATTVNGSTISLTGATNSNANANTINGFNFSNVTPIANNSFNALNFGTGFNSLLKYNGTTLIDGSGLLQNAAIDSSQTYSNLQKVGALNTGSIVSGFGTITTTNTIQGTVLTGTTGFAITGATTAGHYLRNNGTNYVDSALLASDLSGTIFTLAASSGSSQTVSTGATVSILKGASNNLTTTASATDTVTVDIVSNPSFSGTVTASNSSGVALAVSGTPTVSATQSLVQIGNAIAGGNNTAGTGGTYVGINEPSSGAGSTADFLNFQNNNTVELKVTSAGQITAGGLTNGGTGGIITSNGSGVLSSSVLNRDTSSFLTGTLSVGNGGTGNASFTNTNGLLFAGTTTTGALQNLANGASGTILKSNGTGSLPSWVSATGANTCTDCILQDPANTAQNTITSPATAGVVALTLKGNATANADTLDIYNSASTPALQDFFDNNGSLHVGQLIQPTSANSVDLGVSSTGTFRTGYFGTSVNVGGTTLTSSALSGTAGLSVSSGGATTLALDTGAASTITIGTTNANTINFGNATNNTSFNVNGGTGAINIGDNGANRTIKLGTAGGTNDDTIQIGSTHGGTTTIQSAGGITLSANTSVAAGKNLSLASGSGTFTQTYTSGTNNTTAATWNVTNTNATATATTVNAQTIGLTGTASGANTINGLNFSNVTTIAGNTFNGLVFGTGYDSILTAGGNTILDGSGLLQNAGVSSSITYSNLQKVGALNTGSIASGFGTILTTNTIQGTVLTGTTGFAITGATTAGHYLRNNGTNYVDSSLLASDLSGTVSVTNGGTGNASFTNTNGLLFAGTTTTGALQNLANGASGTILKSNGTGSLPSWVSATGANTCTDCLVQVPTGNTANTAANNVISPTAASVIGLTVNGTTSGTAATALSIVQGGAANAVTITQSGGATALTINQSSNNADITATNNSVTNANLISLGQTTSTYTGDAILLNLANGSGTFTGNFVNFKNNGTSEFSVTSAGVVNQAGDLNINTNKFQVTASNGNTIVGGTLQVKGITTAGAVLTDASGNLSSGTINLGSSTYVSGTLPIANGGTNGSAAPTAGAVAYGTGTAYAFTSAGTSGQILKSNGGSAPSFVNATSGNTCTDCLVQVPTSNTAGAVGGNVIQPTAASIIGLTIRETSSGTSADILDIQSASGTTTYDFFDNTGSLNVGANIVPISGTATIDLGRSSGTTFRTGYFNTGVNVSGTTLSSTALGFTGAGSVTSGAGTDLTINTGTGSTNLNLGTVNSTSINVGSGSNTIALNSNTNVAGGKNLVLQSGTGFFQQTYTGTTTDAAQITANSVTTANALEVSATGLTTGSGLKVTTSSNTAANTAWSGNVFNITNAQGTTAVSSGSIAGLDVQFTQATSVTGNTESVARFDVAQNNSSSTDQTVSSILDLGNNDTATGNLVTVQNAININQTNVNNGLFFNGNANNNFLDSSNNNFKVTNAGVLSAQTINSITNGFEINGSAASGHYLRGNGANYVDSALNASDLSGTIFNVSDGTTSSTVSYNQTVTISAGSNISTTNASRNISVGVVSNPTFSGLVTASASGTNALLVSGTPLAGASGATSSLVQLGPNAIAGGNNTATTGGTYLGINEPSSGAGSTSDFVNFQNNGTSELQVTAAGNGIFNGTVTSKAGALVSGVVNSVAGQLQLSNSGSGATAALGVLVANPLVSGSGNITYHLPALVGGASVDICVNTGNCATAGGGVTTTVGGTLNYIAKFTATNNVENSILYDNGTGVTVGYTGVAPAGLFNVGNNNQFQVSSGGNVTAGTYNTSTLNGTSLRFGSAATADIRSASGQILNLNDATGGNVNVGNSSSATTQVVLQDGASSSLTLNSSSTAIVGTFSTTGAATIGNNTTAAAVELKVDAAPAASAVNPLVLLGHTSISGGNSNGTYIGVNQASCTTTCADLLNLQMANAVELQLTGKGELSINGGFVINNNNADAIALNVSGNTSASGTVNASSGFLYSGSGGTAGQYLRSNGTAYVAGSFGGSSGADGAGIFIRNLPATTADNTITEPATANVVGLSIKGNASSGGDILDIYNSASTPVLQDFFDSAGILNMGQNIVPSSTVGNNAIDLGTSARNFRSGYFGTSVFTPLVNPITIATNGGTGTALALTGGAETGTGTTAGGAVNITGGAATANVGGAVVIDGGQGSSSANNGAVNIGGGTTSAVGLGKSGITTTSNGAFTVAANQNLTLNSGTGQFNQTYNTGAAGAAASAQSLGLTNANTGAGITLQGTTFTPTNTASPSSSINTINVQNFAAGTIGGTNVTNGINFASATGYTNFINSPTFQVTSAGVVKYTPSSTVDSNTLVCQNSTGQLAACQNAAVTGTAFIQGGNTFSTTTAGVLGTNNNGNLNLRTNGTDRLILDTSGNLQFQQASSLSTSTGLLTINGNAGVTVGTPNAATSNGITIQSGNATTAGNSAGTILLDTGSFSGAGTGAINIGTTNASAIVLGNSARATNATTTINGTALVKPSSGNDSATAFRVQNAAATATILTVDTTNSGAVTLAGVAPASTGSGTAASAILTVTGPAGGAASTNGGVTGGLGSGISLTSGTGGAATGTTGTSTGGAGGAVGITAGTGGAATSSANGVGGAGGTVTIQGGTGGNGAGTSANGNGGNVVLQAGAGGTGGSGTTLRGTIQFSSGTVFANGTFSSGTNNANITGVDQFSSIIVTATAGSLTFNLPAPTNTISGRVLYISNASTGSNVFTIAPSGGTNFTIAPGGTATFYWNGSIWTDAGFDGGSSSYIQNIKPASGTIQSANFFIQSADSVGNATAVIRAIGSQTGDLLQFQSSTPAVLTSITAAGALQFTGNNSVTTATGATSGNLTLSTGNASGGVSGTILLDNGTFTSGTPTVNIGTTSARAVNLGNTTAATQTLIQGGTGSSAVSIQAGASGTISIGTTATANTINIGNTTSGTSLVLQAPNNSMTLNTTGAVHQTTNDSTTAFVIQNAVSAALLTVDASNSSTGNNLAQNSGCESGTTSCSNWTSIGGGTVSRDTNSGDGILSGVAMMKDVTSTTNPNGPEDTVSAALTATTTYMISFSAKLSSGSTSNYDVAYYRDTTQDAKCSTGNSGASTLYPATITTTWTKFTCYLKTSATTTGSTFGIAVIQTDTTSRTLFVDNMSIVAQVTTATATTAQLRVGGSNGQGLTLLTVDSFAGRPTTSTTAVNSLLGSMYYDTTLGKMQCYESSGWGYCGASPDVAVNLVPEYNGAVLDGAAYGTNNIGSLTSDLCANTGAFTSTNAINSSLCASGELYNYYTWTTIQPTSQSYSMFIRYQLPATYKSISSTSPVTLTARSTDVTTPGTGSALPNGVKFSMYDNTGAQCGSTQTLGSANAWTSLQITSLSGCTLAANTIVMFKIDVTATNGSSAYASNLSFLVKGQ